MVGHELGKWAELGHIGLVPETNGWVLFSDFSEAQGVHIPIVPTTLLVQLPSWEDLPSSSY